MALPATDAFTGTNGTALQTYNPSWTINNGAFVINTSSVAANSAAAESAARWNADAFANDQYSQVVVAAIGSATNIGPAVRCSTSGAATYYGYYANGFAAQLFKNVAGTWTQFGANGAAVAVADTLRLEVAGSTLTPKKNAATDPIGAFTDSAIASGAAGICGFDANTLNRSDNWEGGNLGAAAKSLVFRSFAPLRALLVR